LHDCLSIFLKVFQIDLEQWSSFLMKNYLKIYLFILFFIFIFIFITQQIKHEQIPKYMTTQKINEPSNKAIML